MYIAPNLIVDLMYDENDTFGKSPKEDFNYFKDILSQYNPKADFEFLKKAFAVCCFYHKSDKRKSGKPYYTHPLWVAIILIETFKMYDEIYLAAAFLHDTIEDTVTKVDKVVKETITSKMGNDYLSEIVEALTKISHERLIIENESFREQLIQKHSEEQVEELLSNKQIQKCFTHRKLFQTFIKDQNIIIIKLADRLHNMRTLHYMERPDNPEKSMKKWREIAEETLEFYVRFANRLGFSSVASELQNLSFYFQSDKEVYQQIRNEIENRQSYIISKLIHYEEDINLAFKDTEFSKSSIHLYHRKEYEIYSLTNKLQNPGNLPDFVTCIVSVPVNESVELRKATSKIIQQFGHANVSNYQEGKKSLGEYEFYTIQLKVKKENLDSLEITMMMDKDHDILENFSKVPIKEKRKQQKVSGISNEQLELWSDWMEYIILEKGENAIKDIWDSLDKNLFEDKIVCFSVDKEAIFLPQGSTVLDFAFALSKETGLYFFGAKIQEQVYDVYYKLSGNETIQILKSKKITALPEWKNFVNDYRAIGYLHNFLKNNDSFFEVLSTKIDDNFNSLPKSNFNLAKSLNEGFISKLLVKGINRKQLLNDITKAIGNTDIKKSTIQGSDISKQFEGIFEVHFENILELNKVIFNLLNIRNVKSAEVLNIRID